MSERNLVGNTPEKQGGRIEFDKIVILLTDGKDHILFKVKGLPSPYPAMGWEADPSMGAAKGHAQAYCAENFPGVPVEIIDTTVKTNSIWRR